MPNGPASSQQASAIGQSLISLLTADVDKDAEGDSVLTDSVRTELGLPLDSSRCYFNVRANEKIYEVFQAQPQERATETDTRKYEYVCGTNYSSVRVESDKEGSKTGPNLTSDISSVIPVTDFSHAGWVVKRETNENLDTDGFGLVPGPEDTFAIVLDVKTLRPVLQRALSKMFPDSPPKEIDLLSYHASRPGQLPQSAFATESGQQVIKFDAEDEFFTFMPVVDV